MLIQQNALKFVIIVIIVLDYFSQECSTYHLIEPFTSNNLTRYRRQSSCGRSQFRCSNGQCIPNYNLCDGTAECSDGSDEYTNCNTKGCQPFTYRCAYGACVDGDARCNGQQDCHDNSDEKNCGNSVQNNCGEKFGCQSGECIDQYLVCDGEPNCQDASDETYDLCNSINCQEYSFRCAYGACVDGDTKCDGKRDCNDGSDEEPRICPNITPTTATPPAQGCQIPTIANGNFTVSGLGYVTGTLIPNFSLVNFQCKAGYKLSPATQVVVCMGGAWSEPIPECVSTQTPIINNGNNCPTPQINQGKYVILGQGPHVPLSPVPNYAVLKFSCNNDNYGLSPPNDIVTCVDGKFDKKLPECLLLCPPRISAAVDITCDLNGISQDCNKKVVDGTIASMKCKQHYTETSRGFSTAVCSGGSWDVEIKQCFPDCGDLIPKGTPLIVNGVAAKQGEFPWHVAIYQKNPETNFMDYICGGSIISTKVVLSAAHCFSDNANGQIDLVSEFHVAAGKYYSHYNSPLDNEKFVQKRKIVKIEVPSDTYRGAVTNYAGDIAVGIVESPFVLTNIVKPVCVDWDSEFEDEQLIPDNYGHVVGWGATSTNNPTASFDLKQLTAPYIYRGKCLDIVPQTFVPFVTTDKFCVGYTNGSSVCNGDSGGGLVFERQEFKKKKFFIRGVVSVGPLKEGSCDNNQYGVYTKISQYMPFVRKQEVLNRVK